MKIELTEDGVKIISAKGTLELVWDEYRQLRNIILNAEYVPTK